MRAQRLLHHLLQHIPPPGITHHHRATPKQLPDATGDGLTRAVDTQRNAVPAASAKLARYQLPRLPQPYLARLARLVALGESAGDATGCLLRRIDLWGNEMTTFRTHYDNLKVSRDAPPEVIRAAYKTLSQKYHPDRNGSPDAERIMRILNQAYGVLSDPDQRAEHDAWIDAQDPTAPDHARTADDDNSWTEPSPSGAAAGRTQSALFPQGGRSSFGKLPPGVASLLKDRLRGRRADQELVPTASGNLGYLLKALVPLAFIVVVAISASEARWRSDTPALLAWVAAAAGLFFGSQLRGFIYSTTKPLRPALIVTPAYLVETSWDEVTFWPLPLIRVSNATHHLRNGRYTHTSFSLETGKATRRFTVTSEAAYARFIDCLKSGLSRYLQASEQHSTLPFKGMDDTGGMPLSDLPAPLNPRLSRILWWLGGMALFILAVELFHQYNLTLPAPPPARGSHYSAPSPTGELLGQLETERPVVRTDYIAQRLGAGRVPEHASYIAGEPLEQNRGISQVTVDNSGTGQDVLVKLVRIDGLEASPVRTFFIPSGKTFTAKNINQGHYEVRYISRYRPGASKSEEFSLKEFDTGTGTQYSDVTLTLYAIEGGNMNMQSIPDNQF
ncbi:DnaJ domain-containing protein [Xanthomonas melonis]|uniref:J domain-containing protein n=1 Tax=Xanthomonas melonis TaxID=56456 RepID=UPI001E2E83BA|nr:DnaJ domain-containing protein [Xanthomonas melonis]MCD0280706.1 DnaJ domain-containing protein [Xanthomonas melonis]